MRHRTSRSLVLAALLVAAAACSSSESPKPTSRPLTFDEATQLASVQYDNYQDEGATFAVATAFVTTDDTLSLEGVIDWKNHIGHAVATAKGMESGIVEVYWTDTMVLERRPAADQLLAGLGYQDAMYFARPPDPSNRLLDRALAIVLGLASTQPDNPQLILQKAGSQFMRTDSLRGVAANVLRYGERNVYWVDATTGRMIRFEGNAESGGAPTLVDVISRGVQTITLPAEGEVVSVDEVRSLYDALVQGSEGGSGVAPAP